MAGEKTGSIQETLLSLARPRMSPRELLSLARKSHPGASKKEIVRAAFGTIITVADSDLEKARLLQNFALSERAGDDE
jgi:hypothetical protein